MREMTATNLRSAFSGESMAHMRYLRWADRAEEEGYPNVARLFRAISHAERVHATNHFNELKNESGDFPVTAAGGFGVGSTSDNLQGAINGENFEINEMYPAYLAVAELQGEKGAIRSMNFAISAEKIHSAMYQEAKQSVDAGRDKELGPIRICGVCGYTAEGEIPQRCPVCGAGRDKFDSFE